MRLYLFLRNSLCLVVLILSATAAHADSTLTVGDTFPRFSAKDQHGSEFHFESPPSIVFIAFDMGAAKRANQALADNKTAFEKSQAVFVSNVFGMPAIGRVFAFRKMRKYPHRIVLADEQSLLDPFPRRPSKVTAIYLDDSFTIKSIEFWNPEQNNLCKFLQVDC